MMRPIKRQAHSLMASIWDQVPTDAQSTIEFEVEIWLALFLDKVAIQVPDRLALTSMIRKRAKAFYSNTLASPGHTRQDAYELRYCLEMSMVNLLGRDLILLDDIREYHYLRVDTADRAQLLN